MGGIFGGLLFVIQVLGGLFLFLLIGSKAWKSTDKAERLRSLFGGAVFGLVVGIAVSIFVMTEHDRNAFPPEAMIIICVFGGIIIALVLYGLHRTLE